MEVPEIAMDCHLARSESDEHYLVIGSRVSILLDETTLADASLNYLTNCDYDQVFISGANRHFSTVAEQSYQGTNLYRCNSRAGVGLVLGSVRPRSSDHSSSSPAPASAFHIRPPSDLTTTFPRQSSTDGKPFRRVEESIRA